MKITTFITAGAMALAGAMLAACGGSDSPSSGAGGGSSGAGGGGTTTSTTSTSSTSGGGGGGAALSCDDYCATIMGACTAANQQYPDLDHCKAACASFPVGTAADTSGDTLGCRTYHAGASKSDPATHCAHAGPSGGDQNPGDDMPGPCGDACEAFCDLAQASCTGDNAQYADKAACLADCKTFAPSAAPFSTADASTNDYGCRLYHLTVAALDPAGHCGHITSSSPVCTM